MRQHVVMSPTSSGPAGRRRASHLALPGSVRGEHPAGDCRPLPCGRAASPDRERLKPDYRRLPLLLDAAQRAVGQDRAAIPRSGCAPNIGPRSNCAGRISAAMLQSARSRRRQSGAAPASSLFWLILSGVDTVTFRWTGKCRTVPSVNSNCPARGSPACLKPIDQVTWATATGNASD